jgi:lipid kinase YegS
MRLQKPLKRISLILHEKAESDSAVQEAIARVRDIGHHIEAQVARKPGDGARFANRARKEKVDVVIAGGGDGALNEVLNGVFQADETPRVSVGVMPIGTGNDFATGCEIPADPFQALLLAAEETPVMIDVGKINSRFFLNIVSAGFGADGAASTPEPIKKIIGAAAYSLVGLVKAIKMQPHEYRILSQEGEERGKAMMMAVCNGRQAAGGYQVAPKALLDDGLLDFVLVREFPLTELNQVIRDLSNLGEDGKFILYRQMQSLSIELTEEVPVNVDGEPIRAKSAHFELLYRRLPFILPAKAAIVLDYKESEMAA